MPELTIAETLIHSAVKINSLKSGNLISTGTGFFFNFALNGNLCVPCIVTNKHVAFGSDELAVRFHFKSNGKPSGRFLDCKLDISEGFQAQHPDERVDLCAIPITNVVNMATAQGTPIFFSAFDMNVVPNDQEWQEFDALEEILMIGYPRGISDEINNLPIARRGITATTLSKNYNGRPEFMIDMACFPGSSGSPIVLQDRHGHFKKDTNVYNLGENRSYLLGILYSGPVIANNGRIVFGDAPRVEVSTHMHLDIAIRSSELRVLDQMIMGLARMPNLPAEVGPVIDA